MSPTTFAVTLSLHSDLAAAAAEPVVAAPLPPSAKSPVQKFARQPDSDRRHVLLRSMSESTVLRTRRGSGVLPPARPEVRTRPVLQPVQEAPDPQKKAREMAGYLVRNATGLEQLATCEIPSREALRFQYTRNLMLSARRVINTVQRINESGLSGEVLLSAAEISSLRDVLKKTDERLYALKTHFAGVDYENFKIDTIVRDTGDTLHTNPEYQAELKLNLPLNLKLAKMCDETGLSSDEKWKDFEIALRIRSPVKPATLLLNVAMQLSPVYRLLDEMESGE